MLKTCRNTLCREDLTAADQAAMHVLAPLGFCPSCRAAIAYGFQAGTMAMAVIGALAAFIEWVAL